MIEIINKTGFFFPVDMNFVKEKMAQATYYTNRVEIIIYKNTFLVYICGNDNLGEQIYSVPKSVYDESVNAILNATIAYWGHSWERVTQYTTYEWDWLILGQSKKGEVFPFGISEAKGLFLRIAGECGLNTPTSVTYNREHTDW